MKPSQLLLVGLFLGTTLSAPAALAVIDVNAEVVTLHKSCTQAGQAQDNCFTDLNTLNTWIWNTRNPQPSATSPLLVEIGPGTFTGRFTCENKSNVSLRGAGIRQTIIEASSSPISTTNCANLTFSHMTLRNTQNLFGVKNLGGSTVWDNVEIDGFGYAWFDSPTGCGGVAPGTHYWFNSRITARSAGSSTTAYFNICDASWFFGSEITSVGTGQTGVQITPLVVPGGEVHVYGSVIRAIAGAGVTTNSMVAASASGAGQIHIHGTGIDVLSTGGNNIAALSADTGGQVHANQAAYNLKTGTGGTVTRIAKDANSATHVHAPYFWEEHSNPPAILSVTGADTAVVTSTADGHPHIVIYDSTCSSKWFDTVTRACR